MIRGKMNKNLKAAIIMKYGCQADFALAVGVDEPNVSRVVRGRRQLSPEQQKQWAKALDCKPMDIFGNASQNSK
jgi:DNA-binding transcriptional regulator YdaS (Cro superfamily)